MKIAVVTYQPWDVVADVLVVPLAADPVFEGPLGEIDRRSGGELQALQAFGELSGKLYDTALASSGEVRAGRLLAIGVGPVAKLDRETVVRIGATAERRLGGRAVRSVAFWLDELPRIEGGIPAVAELITRGVVEGSYDPQSIYRDKAESPPPVLDELILLAPAGDRSAILRSAERGRIMGEGANRARSLANRASNDVTPK